MRSEAEIYADRGEVMYMHYCKIAMYADRAGGKALCRVGIVEEAIYALCRVDM